MPLRPRRTALASAAAAVILGVCGAPAARAATDTATSTNWAGYAATRSGVTFRHVSATWVQPAVSCAAGAATYSATWVGLGGNTSSSAALEQIGTEADCSASGTAHYSTWYELLPDVSHSAKLTIKAGDSVHASVAVSGHLVTLKLANLTRGKTITKTLRAAAVDTTSAEWIVEAPSLCTGTSLSSCRTSALANFNTTNFTQATATTTAGHTGTISDSAWNATTINLATSGGGTRFAGGGRASSPAVAAATTAALDPSGSSFAVAYQPGTTGTSAPSGSGGPAFAGGRQR